MTTAPIPKTNVQRQALWCDPKKHIIRTGEQYVVLAGGGMACVEHQHEPLPVVNLAGSLR